MKNVRLKAALHPQQLHNRLKYHPEIIELQINEADLYEPEKIITTIQQCKARGIRIYLHHPSKFKRQYLDIISDHHDVRNFYDWSSELLAEICKQEKIKCVIHCHYAQSNSSHYSDKEKRIETRKRIEEILRLDDDCFLWEDTIKGIFSAENPFLLEEIVKPLQLPLNIDISHSFIALKGKNDKLQRHLDSYHSFAKYYHLVDSNGMFHDSLPLGRGKIEWEMVKHYVEDADFIFEIDLKDSNYMDCSPMIESVEFFNNLGSKIGN